MHSPAGVKFYFHSPHLEKFNIILNKKLLKKDIKKDKEKVDGGGVPSGWKFNKTRQVWLMKNWMNIEKVPSKHFKLFTKYACTLQGKAREKL